MSNSFRIITHTGKAHMDEVVAAALLCIHKNHLPDEVLRMDNREVERLINTNELTDNDWVLDCGLHLQPSERLFDHHQDRDLNSTALLVFNHFFPELEESKLHESVSLISLVDTQGLKSLNDFEQLDESLTYFSFAQKLLLKGFEIDPLEVLRITVDVLKAMIDFDKSCQLAYNWLHEEGHVETVEIKGIKILHYLCTPPMELVQPLRAVDKKMVDLEEMDAVYSFDDKVPEERSLFRTIHGHERLDFSLSNPENCHFCHAAGFLMKFTPADDQEWIRLIEQSIL